MAWLRNCGIIQAQLTSTCCTLRVWLPLVVTSSIICICHTSFSPIPLLLVKDVQFHLDKEGAMEIREIFQNEKTFFCNFQSWRQITATEGVYSVEMDLPVLATHWTRPLHLNTSYEGSRKRKKAPVTTSTTSYFLLFVWLSVYSAADSLNVFFSLSSSGSEYE